MKINLIYKKFCEFVDRNDELLCCPFWWIVLVLGLFCVWCAADDIRPSFRRDPNVACREVIVDYTSHPLVGRDCNDLAVVIEQVTGRPWIFEFIKYWLDCHPCGDPVSRCDVNFDGVTDWRDFNILATCRIFYKTRTGTKYHVRGCTYLRKSAIAIMDPNGLLPCAVCIVAPAWLGE